MLKFPVGIAIQAIDSATAKTRAITAGIAKATDPLKRAQSSIAGLGEAAQFPKMLEGFRGVGSAIGEVGAAAKRSALLIGGMAAAAAGATFALVKGFADAGDSAFKGAQKVGIAVEALQELRWAASLADVEAEELDASLIKLTRNAALAARGESAASKPFERLGISVVDANGKIRDARDLLGEIAEKFGALDDPLKRAALAQELFGKSGANLIPLLAGGRAGLEDAAREARELGIVLSRDAAESGERFNDALTRVGAALSGVRNAIGAELLPILLELSNRFRAWISENLPRVREFAQRLARELPAAIERVVSGFRTLWDRTEPVRMVLGKLYEILGPLGTALAAVAVVLVATMVPAIASTIAALATLSAALVGTPAGWVVLALTAVAAALAAVTAGVVYAVANWDELSARFPRTAAILERLGKLGFLVLQERIVASVSALEFLARLLFEIPERALAYWDGLARGFSAYWENVRLGFSVVYDWIAARLEGLAGLVPDWVRDVLGFESGPDQAAAPALSSSPAVADRLAPAPTSIADRIGAPRAAESSETRVRVDFANLPRGARVEHESKGPADVDLGMGWALVGP